MKRIGSSAAYHVRRRIVSRIPAPLLVLMALAMALILPAGGQAVGPVLSGSITGSVGLVVDQAVGMDIDHGMGDNPTVGGASDSVTTRNDEGTEFTVAMELQGGRRAAICIMLQNDSGEDASGLLELQVPRGISVEVEEFSGSTAQDCPADDDAWLGQLGDNTYVDEAQLSARTWLLVVRDGAGNPGASYDGIRLLVEPQDSLAPGFYTFSGRITQTGG